MSYYPPPSQGLWRAVCSGLYARRGCKTPFDTPFYDNFRCKDMLFLENKQVFLHFFFLFLIKN